MERDSPVCAITVRCWREPYCRFANARVLPCNHHDIGVEDQKRDTEEEERAPKAIRKKVEARRKLSMTLRHQGRSN